MKDETVEPQNAAQKRIPESRGQQRLKPQSPELTFSRRTVGAAKETGEEQRLGAIKKKP